mmetsp:Transcript_34639/g.65212  ORF Transcript_34639/g.65212 Transcript_34639/m.65212 type:complete len:410 (+) Transcript_34639:180-1409(+)
MVIPQMGSRACTDLAHKFNNNSPIQKPVILSNYFFHAFLPLKFLDPVAAFFHFILFALCKRAARGRCFFFCFSLLLRPPVFLLCRADAAPNCLSSLPSYTLASRSSFACRFFLCAPSSEFGSMRVSPNVAMRLLIAASCSEATCLPFFDPALTMASSKAASACSALIFWKSSSVRNRPYSMGCTSSSSASSSALASPVVFACCSAASFLSERRLPSWAPAACLPVDSATFRRFAACPPCSSSCSASCSPPSSSAAMRAAALRSRCSLRHHFLLGVSVLVSSSSSSTSSSASSSSEPVSPSSSMPSTSLPSSSSLASPSSSSLPPSDSEPPSELSSCSSSCSALASRSAPITRVAACEWPNIAMVRVMSASLPRSFFTSMPGASWRKSPMSERAAMRTPRSRSFLYSVRS